MKTHFLIWMRVLVVLFGVGLFTGCGKADPKLSIRAAESEKDLPTTALVRKIELSYHDVDGNEKMRQSVAVYGLGQPISLKADLLKDLDWDAHGTFQATAYSSDGGLYLQGIGRGDPDSGDAIEIVMEHGPASGGSSAALVTSAVLKSMVVLNEPNFTGYSLDLTHLVAVTSSQDPFISSSESFGQNGCANIPEITVRGDAAIWPLLRFFTQYKGPTLSFELRDSGLGSVLQTGVLAAGQTGDPEFAISDKIGGGVFLASDQNAVLSIFSEKGRFEGCLNLKTHLAATPVQVRFIRKPKTLGFRYSPLGCWSIQNPNAFPISTVIHVTPTGASLAPSGFPLSTIYGFSDDAKQSTDTLSSATSGRIVLELAARSSGGACIFGYSLSADVVLGSEFVVYPAGFVLNWQIQSISGQEAF